MASVERKQGFGQRYALGIRLLRRHLSWGQIVGFGLASLVGLVIILLSLQIYRDAEALMTRQRTLLSADYLVIAKEVTGLGTLLQTDNTFAPAEIEELRRQKFVRRLGEFVPARFRVTAGINMGMEVYTYMFLESVPDEYLDIRPEGWRFDSLSRRIPLVIPRNYLGLYNAAFAQSQGLPLLSESTLGLVPLTIGIAGPHGIEEYRGEIVGFSDRLNTLLAPKEFIDWANARYATTEATNPSRLIMEVVNPSDTELVSYLHQRGYRVEGEKLGASESVYMLRLIAIVVVGVGLVISLLSLYLLMLSLYLLIQKNTKQLEHMLLLGYHPREVARPYQMLALLINLLVLALALLSLGLVRNYYLSSIGQLFAGFDGGAVAPTYVLALGVSVVSSALVCWTIYRRIHLIPAFGRA